MNTLPQKRIDLPLIKCHSCGYYEQNTEINTIGFCYKFFETVNAVETNPACWTNKDHDYFNRLSHLKDNWEKQKKVIQQKKIDLHFNNQLSIFPIDNPKIEKNDCPF